MDIEQSKLALYREIYAGFGGDVKATSLFHLLIYIYGAFLVGNEELIMEDITISFRCGCVLSSKTEGFVVDHCLRCQADGTDPQTKVEYMPALPQ